MFRRIFGAALGAGIAVGLVIAAIQHIALVPLIDQAEVYEEGARAHQHARLWQGTQDPLPAVAYVAETVSETIPLAHNRDDGLDESSQWRAVLTWIATTLTSVGFSFLLAGLFAVSGRNIDAREGLLWGLAGFVAVTLAPALGLLPELPGSVAADLALRQVWWIGTVLGTMAGLGLIVFVPTGWAIAMGVGLLVAPHVIGAPHHEGTGVAPPELAALFAARSLGINAIFWILLGLCTGTLYRWFGEARAI